MTNKLKISALVLTPAVIASGVVLSASAFASEVPTSPSLNRSVSVSELDQSSTSTKSNPLSQVTSVSQLSDVQPTDWAFQALQSLVERYGCIAGYPNRTYRGNRPLTRYEFAAGLNACMDRVNELIASATSDLVKKEDLEAIKKLQEEFNTELATLRGEVDGLESRTKTLEAQQFSTTTKLKGVVIFALAGTVTGSGRVATPAGNRTAGGRANIPDNTTFSDRVRLNLDTSFSGQDRLRVRLQAANFTNLGTVTGSAPARISFDAGGGNTVQIHRLEYTFPVGSKTKIYVEANQGEFNDIFDDNRDTLSPLGNSDEGSLFRFARFSPIYRLGPAANAGGGLSGSAGFGFEHTLATGTDGRKKLQLQGSYLANNAASPLDGTGNGGLFGGGFATIGQLIYRPIKKLDIAATYARAYSDNGNGITGGTGTQFANNPFNGVPTTTNNYGVEAQWRALPKFTLAAWGGYTQAYATRSAGVGANLVRAGNEATIINWNVTAAFPDVIRKGDLAAISFGQPPYIDSSDFAARRRSANGTNDAATWNLEASYRFTVNDNISFTPGVLYVINPENNSTNDNIFVGIIRTVFRF